MRILLEAGADPQQRYAPNATAANAETFQASYGFAIPGTTAIDHALAIYDYWLDRSATEEVNSAIVAATAECLRLLQQSAKL
ncbi:MAG: hypothetical protein HY785_01110 [Oscillatoriophycideae cyanobacterium NC_groundwater_1537_Pr4_S-0.65um_50_18]|nr:hypothetical protein [Oscillatoriophycideae cyanobacterium NC_groundwater_1537_Pr4_S-0.65um_50_18]